MFSLLLAAAALGAPATTVRDTVVDPAPDSSAIAARAPSAVQAPDPRAPRPGPPAPDSLRPAANATGPVDTTTPRRPRAIEYSDAYARRLAIHRVGSYAMLPLFAGEYVLGERLLSPNEPPGWVKGAHGGVAFGLAALFTVNTVTGVWNLYDSRHDTSDRTRKWLHTALLLASDAGFAYTGSLADQAHRSEAGRTRHKNAALVSMGLSTAGTAMMWLWKK